MQAKSALLSFEHTHLNSPPSLADSLLIEKVKQITKLFVEDTVDVPQRVTLEQIYKRVKEVFNNRRKVKLSNYDLHNSPWVLFESFDNEKPLIEQWRFWAFYSKLVKGIDNYRFFLALYSSYITSYPHEQHNFKNVQQHIKNLLESSNNTKLLRLKATFEGRLTLEPDAHIAILNDVERTGDIEKTLRDNALLDGFEGSKLTQLVITDYIKNLPSSTATNINVQLENLTKFAERDGELRYLERRIEFANSILFTAGNIELTVGQKETLKEFFLQHYGDPRVETSGWHGVDESAVAVMQSWLVEKTMEDFFNLLSYVSNRQSDADRHWTYRKRFWNAYLKKGYITEAWVCLGTTAYQLAPQYLKGNNHYGTLTGGTSALHSALLIKIGHLVIKEWSHSGAYHIWNDDNYAPDFYEKHYHSTELTEGATIKGSHMGNETGGWQGKVADYINQQTGLKVLAKDYMND